MPRSAEGPDASPAQRPASRWAGRREARRLALASIFEADFGQRTAGAILERHLDDGAVSADNADFARSLVAAVVAHREVIDATIARTAPAYPVGQLARMDRSLLRSALGEVLHSPATPTTVAIAEWVELARSYSGEPCRRLLNGVLGRVVAGAADTGPVIGPDAGHTAERS